MRGTPAGFNAEVGESPRVVESGTTFTTIRLGNALVTLFGTVDERQALVEEMAKELGLLPRLSLVEGASV